MINKILKEKSSIEMIIIINKYIKSINIIRKLIKTTKRLRSDDIYIIISDEKKVIVLRKNKKWIKRLSDKVRIIIKKYNVLFYKVRTKVIDIKD